MCEMDERGIKGPVGIEGHSRRSILEFKEFGELVMIVALDWTVVEEDKSVLELVEGELEELQEPELGELLLLITMSIRSSLGYGFSPWLGLFSDNVSIDSIPESSPC